MANPSSTKNAIEHLNILIRSRYPIIYIVSHEEARVEKLLSRECQARHQVMYAWSSSLGLKRLNSIIAEKKKHKEHTEPVEVLKYIFEAEITGVFLLKDFHQHLEEPEVVRWLRELVETNKKCQKTIIITAPEMKLPGSLEKDVSVVDFPLPDIQDLSQLLESLCKTLVSNPKYKVNLNKAEFNQLASSALGLTLNEAENAFTRAVVIDKEVSASDIELVMHEKKQIIRKSGILEYVTNHVKLDDIGGLAHLKHWLGLRCLAFGEKARQFGLPIPKGALLLGAPGCGKSLTAKAIANAWQLPLLRLDFGKLFSSFIGSSEENMRNALKTAETIAPAVLWIDELEKGLSGNSASSHTDGGVAKRIFGTFLTWMQEKSSFIFVVATANNVDLLPPELMRKGRFDEIFFVDLPDPDSRQEIVHIHLRKKGRDPKKFTLDEFIALTENYSGAEIEHCVVEGLFNAFQANRDLNSEDLVNAARDMTPLSITYAEELSRLKEWATTRARNANTHRPQNHIPNTPQNLKSS